MNIGEIELKKAFILKVKYLGDEYENFKVSINLFKRGYTIKWAKDDSYITSVSFDLMRIEKETFENNLFDTQEEAELIFECMD